MKHSVVLAFVAVLAAGCGASKPTPLAPAPPGSPAPPAPPPITFVVSGTVTLQQGGAANGARVRVVEQEAAPTTADLAGRYSLSGVFAGSALMPPLISASLPGFFTAIEYAAGAGVYEPLRGDARRDLTLTPLEPITAGETVAASVTPDDAHCSHWGYGSHPCKKLALVTAAAGTLAVTLFAPDSRFDVDVVGPEGTFVFYGSPRTGTEFRIEANAGATYEIRVIPWETPRDFRLLAVVR